MQLKVTIHKIHPPLEGTSYGRTEEVFDQVMDLKTEHVAQEYILDIVEAVQKVARDIDA